MLITKILIDEKDFETIKDNLVFLLDDWRLAGNQWDDEVITEIWLSLVDDIIHKHCPERIASICERMSLTSHLDLTKGSILDFDLFKSWFREIVEAEVAVKGN